MSMRDNKPPDWGSKSSQYMNVRCWCGHAFEMPKYASVGTLRQEGRCPKCKATVIVGLFEAEKKVKK